MVHGPCVNAWRLLCAVRVWLTLWSDKASSGLSNIFFHDDYYYRYTIKARTLVVKYTTPLTYTLCLHIYNYVKYVNRESPA